MLRSRLLPLLLGAALALPLSLSAAEPAPVSWVHADRVPAEILALGDELVEIRRDLHRHPELGFETARTCGVIKAELEKRGIRADLERFPGAVIAVVEGSRPGATVALRADMDALAMPDLSGIEWKSTVPGRSHACGHDGHVAWLIGTLEVLEKRRDFPGRVVGIFQPAEEIGTGARRMIEAGVLDEFAPAEIYAGHATPEPPKGTIGVHAGPSQASCDFFRITLKGRGMHASMPQHALDPVPTAALLTSSLQTIVSRRVDPVEPAVVTVSAVKGGDLQAPNVIAETLEMAGTVRTFSPKVRDLVETEIRRMTEHVAAAQGLTAEVRFDRLTPPLINAAGPAAAARAAVERTLGSGASFDTPLLMAAEDFAEFLNRVPGSMVQVGLGDEKGADSQPGLRLQR